MAHRRWARTFAVSMAVALALCLGVLMPIVLSLYRSDLPGDSVEAAPSDAFLIGQPVALSNAPAVRLERGTVAFVDGGGRVMPALPAQSDGAMQAVPELRAFNALLTLGADPPDPRNRTATTAIGPRSPYEDVLASSRYETLSLRRSTIVLKGFFEEPEILSDAKVDISLRRRGQIGIKGSALLRGARVNFDASINVAQAERKGGGPARVPLKLALKSEFVDFNFDGRMISTPEEMDLQGPAEFNIVSGRRFARWFGSFWPSGAGLRDIAAKGEMRLTRQSIMFDKVVARMDGNEATGVLGFRLRRPRPVVSGTLALKAFDANPYFSSAPEARSDSISWTSVAAGALTVPLGMHLDADLRLSAGKVIVGTYQLQNVAATVALKDGRLQADIAEAKFNGGEGGGQLTADFTSHMPKVTARGKLDQIDLATLSSPVGGAQLLQGRGSIVADLVGSGHTVRDLIAGFAGKLAIRVQSPGKILFDLKGLAEAAQVREIVGWSSAGRGSTDFDALELKLVLKDGTILTESAEVRTADGSWNAAGVLNVPSDRIDMRLIQTGPVPQGAKPSSAPKRALDLQGPLSEPRITPSK